MKIQIVSAICFLKFLEIVEACGVNQTNLDGFLEVQPNCENFLEIPKTPGKSISLKLPCHAESVYSIWMIVPESKTPIHHSNKSIDCSRSEDKSQTFQAPANVGLKIVSKLTAKIDVKILDGQQNLCAYPYILLTSSNLNQSRVIQNDTTFSSSQECVYRLDIGLDILSNSSINEIKIRFSDIANLIYQQRIYRKNGKIESKIFTTGRNFLLEPFDIKINEYVRIPQINVTFGKNLCHNIDRISTANKTLTFQPTSAQLDCENSLSILNIKFLQPKNNEIIYLEHNLNQANLKIWNLDKYEIIMDTTYFLKNAALNISALKIHIENSQNWQINLTRLEIPENCQCPTFGSLISSENSRLSLKSRNCANLFCHVRLENSRKLTMNIDLKASDNGENKGSIEPDFFVLVENGVYFRSAIITSTNYPNPYCANRDCKTTIMTSPNATLNFWFYKFHVDSEGDSLEIYNGRHIDSNQCVAKLHGKKERKHNEEYQTGNQAVLLFQANAITTKDDIGYVILVKSEPLNPSDLTTSTELITTSQKSTTNAEISTSTEIFVASEKSSSSIPNSLIFFIILLIILGAGIFSYFYKDKIISQINSFRTKTPPPSGFENMNTQIF
ncbi:unnamed protein product [Caenorhabditis angaria]|uniref:CUB domain-containing protein n=1 Tax=Caenorhabditis angaria TaxID=860376 RepID=A0A9P1I6F1_9PELO|nr:unnamed protein product [Caenorhabditis angaria]